MEDTLFKTILVLFAFRHVIGDHAEFYVNRTDHEIIGYLLGAISFIFDVAIVALTLSFLYYSLTT